MDLNPPKLFALKVAAADAAEKVGRVIRCVNEAVSRNGNLFLERSVAGGRSKANLVNQGSHLTRRIAEGHTSVDEATWTIVPTATAAATTQAQGFASVLDLYLSDPYKSHWSGIQKLAESNHIGDLENHFQYLLRYALEGFRLNTSAFGLTRIAEVDTTIEHGGCSVPIKKGDRIFVDFATACLDPTVFPKMLRERERRECECVLRADVVRFGHITCIGFVP